jgi:prolyl-tRNA editing enzyme YbaK/EbsC (Cys-tRNA(Pro) deacylase)
MTELPPVARALAELRISYRLFVHAGPVHSLEQAAHERQQLPDQVIRSIVFRVGRDEFLMALMAGDRQIAWPALRRYLGQSRLALATEDEVRSVTGYERGAIAPFGLPSPMRILADESIFAHEEISLGSGVRGTAVIMTSSALQRALGDVEVVDLTGGLQQS